MREAVFSVPTLVRRGLGVCPPMVLDHRLELESQAIVLKVFFGQNRCVAQERQQAAKRRDTHTYNEPSARPRRRHCVQEPVAQ